MEKRSEEDETQKPKKRTFPFINRPSNDENKQTEYPKLPKQCLRPQLVKNAAILNDEEFCMCKGDVPVMISCMLVTLSQENLNNNGEDKAKKGSAHSLKSTSAKENTERDLSTTTTHKSHGRFERGFKTEARHKFLKTYEDVIPNLSDAVREGRKHDFFGWNVHFFRG